MPKYLFASSIASCLLILHFLSLFSIAQAAVVEELTSQEFYNGIQNSDYDIVIDVRRQDEWDQGHIENATLVIDLALGGLRFLPIEDCKGACSIAVYCRSGSRARAAANFLASVGFSTPIYNGQGVSQWTAAGYPLVTNTPSFEPECLTKAAYICPDAGSGGGGIDNLGVCFSGDMEVQVKDKGFYKMKDVRIGDEVLVEGDDVYESIYSLAHADATQKAKFLKLLPSGLELSENHMVFIENRGAIPARMVRVGDKLVMVGGNSKNRRSHENVVVEQIKTVTRRGVFAPFTKSGTIVVNGVLASTFIAFQPDKYLSIGSVTTPFTYQWLARTFQLPQYWFGRTGDGESGNSKITKRGGMSSWIARPFDFANWLFLLNDDGHQKQTNGIVMIVILAPIISLLMVMSAIDVVFTHSSLSILVIVGVALLAMIIENFIVSHRNKSSTKKTIRHPKKRN